MTDFTLSVVSPYGKRPSNYQSFQFPEGRLLGTHDTVAIWNRAGLPDSLRGMSFLDVGCAAGAYLVEAALRGALTVDGIDEARDCCDWATEALKVVVLSILTASDEPIHAWATVTPGRYPEGVPSPRPHDIVIALSIVHHQSRPMEFLRALRRDTEGRLWIEWELWDESLQGHRLDRITEDTLPPVSGAKWGLGWYPTRDAAMEAMETCGFSIQECRGKVRDRDCGPAREVFICR